MKYIINTLFIFCILLNSQFAQVRVESSTGNVTIGDITTSSHKLDLKGDLFISPQSSFPSSTILFGNTSGVELGLLEFNDYTNSTNLSLQSNFGDIRINAEEEIRFLTNSGTRAVMKTDGMFFRDSKYLGWEESGIRKAYLQYNGQDMFLDNDEVNGDINLDAGGRIHFDITGTTRMTLTEFGYLAIGTSQANQPLTVNGNVSLPAGSSYGFYEGSALKAGVAYNGTDMYIVNDEGSGIVSVGAKRYVSLSTNGIEHLRVALDGNIGIGTNTPAHKLQINGDIGMTGQILGVSDKRTKKDINGISNALDKIEELQPVSYHFDESNFSDLNLPDGIQFGFVAQEVESILPDLVSVSSITTDKNGISIDLKGINYIQLIPILTQALKDQHAQVNSQEDRMNQQQQLIEEQSLLIAELQKEIKHIKERNQQ